MKNLILASSSTIHGSGYLEYLQPQLKTLFEGVSEILFIPYARPSGISYDAYTEVASKGLFNLGVKVKGIHQCPDPKKGLNAAQAVFVGGGNTFVLVDTLQKLGLMSVLKKKIAAGMPYLGTSAGSNICGVSMQTTNDMPIVQPESFSTLGIIPFNLNAHFIVADKNSTHKGETRETRIKEFHVFNTVSVIGLQEGSWLQISGNQVKLEGALNAFLFEQNRELQICKPNYIF